MKYRSFLILFGLSGLMLSFSDRLTVKRGRTGHYEHIRHSTGAPAGRSGAPGELNCTACHSGSVLDGSLQNSLAVTLNGDTVSAYEPSTTYTIRVSIATNPPKKGFQATVLDGNNQFAGTFTALTSTAISSGSSGRKYANHKLASTSPGTSVWEWEWTSPDVDKGPLKFYLATNEANGNGQNTGDKIYLSQHNLGSVLSVKEVAALNELQVYVTPDGAIGYRFDSREAGRLSVYVYDFTGRLVASDAFRKAVSGKNSGELNVPGATPGAYFVHILVDNNTASRKVILP